MSFFFRSYPRTLIIRFSILLIFNTIPNGLIDVSKSSLRNTSIISLLISLQMFATYLSFTFFSLPFFTRLLLVFSTLSLFFIYFYSSSLPSFSPLVLYLPTHSQFSCSFGWSLARSITNSPPLSLSPHFPRFQPPLSGPPTHLPAPSRRLFPDRLSARVDSLRSKRCTFRAGVSRQTQTPPLLPCIIPRSLLAASNDPYLYSTSKWRCAANRIWTAGYKRDAPRNGEVFFQRGYKAVDLNRHVELAPESIV